MGSRETPMMRQYREMKERYPDCILFFRLGDFYEMFFDDAVVAARILDITLTSREAAKGERVPMCGVPYHSAEQYLVKLVEAGYRVAICEQVEDPRTAKGLVRREVVRVVTPGTLFEGSSGDESRYVAALDGEGARYGLAYADVSTGEFVIAELDGPRARDRALDELARLQAAECLLGPGVAADQELERVLRDRGCALTRTEAAAWRYGAAAETLSAHFGVAAVEQAEAASGPAAVAAAGALLAYLRETQKVDLRHLHRLRTDPLGQWLSIDAGSRRNLELVRRLRDGSRQGTLLWVLDQTLTAMGGRLLRQWVERPLVDRAAIEARLDAVEALVLDPFLRDDLRRLLDGVYDLPRLIARVGYQQANGRDLLALARSLERLRPIRERLAGVEAGRLAALRRALPELDDLADHLRRALVDDPPVTTTEGGLIRDGYDPRVDELRLAMREGRRWIASLEASERERTGIKSLKVGFNKVFGYYIEVTRANRHLVPDDYERRQTLANAERYVTPALKEMEAKILGAEERLAALEHELFCQLREEVARRIPAIQAAADVLAELDVLASLAEVAARYDYVRPRLADDRRLRIRAGRHPVLDRTLAGRFVPNDVDLDGERERVMLITGPNMAGKSTFMRQVALIVIMAQMGSFVPAEAAEIGLVDRIFCRVGASDDLASGQSTFMVEVAETALAVHNATSRSLILLDEIGRGTSTFDGIAIARAVIEFIHDRIGARTLVSTHYHELTSLAATRPGIRNYHARVAEEGDEIRFLWRIVPGGADRSYGINVARLAGLPVEIIERAKEILAELDRTARPRQLSLADLAGGSGQGAVQGAGEQTGPHAARGGGERRTAAREAGRGATRDGSGRSLRGTEEAADQVAATADPAGRAGAGAGGPVVGPADTGALAGSGVVHGGGGPGGADSGAVEARREALAAARRWLEELASLDLLRMTPLDAMNVLYAWQRRARRWQEQWTEVWPEAPAGDGADPRPPAHARVPEAPEHGQARRPEEGAGGAGPGAAGDTAPGSGAAPRARTWRSS